MFWRFTLAKGADNKDDLSAVLQLAATELIQCYAVRGFAGIAELLLQLFGKLLRIAALAGPSNQPSIMCARYWLFFGAITAPNPAAKSAVTE